MAKENKRSLLKHVLKNNNIEHVLVFTRTKHGADRVAKELNSSGIISEAIHGNKSQGAREGALKTGASVFSLQGIGRTGRAGSTGKALSFCTKEEIPYMKDINKLIKQTIEVVSVHSFA